MNRDTEQLNLLAIFHYVVAGLAGLFSLCILIAGRSLALCKRYSFAMVISCIECLFIPFGTILGVFTIVVLSRESVKALFASPGTSV